MIKVERSPALELVGMAGIDPGVGRPAARARARPRRHRPAAWPALLDAGRRHRPGVRRDLGRRASPSTRGCWPSAGIRSVDLTPAALGPAVVPPVNLDEHARRARGQPDHLRRAGDDPDRGGHRRASPTLRYAETVSTVVVALGRARARARTSTSSRPSTARGLETIGGAREAKAIIILNPADPPIMMRNTIYAEIDDPDRRCDRGRDRRPPSPASPSTSPATA